MDALVPMASQPTDMSGRNWMMRRLLIDAVRNDPEWKDGNYTVHTPRLQVANVFFGIATNGGSLAYYNAAPSREKADKVVADRLAAPFTADANDFIYQWDASRDYNPTVGHTRRFNPSHQWVHKKIAAGEIAIQQMDVQTYFFRRQNMNALASRARGPTTCCGTTPRTRWTCSPTRPAARSSPPTRSRGRCIPSSASRWTCRSS